MTEGPRLTWLCCRCAIPGFPGRIPRTDEGRCTQEIFNSPYATDSFRNYAEKIAFEPTADKGSYDVAASGESIRMLSAAAKEEGVWLVGGGFALAAEKT